MKVSPSANIQLKEGTHIAPCVLLPGDPLRARYIAETYLDQPVLFNDVRNMFGYTGTFMGKEVSVMGSGMGIPSMLIYVNELYRFFGVESIIRVGSAGALQDQIHVRDVVIAESAETNSSCVQAYGAQGISGTIGDKRLLETARAAAAELKISAVSGKVFTTDYFYNPDPKAAQKMRDKGLLAVEMETAGLYLCARANKKKALSLLTISDHVFKDEILSPEEIREGFDDMIRIALITAVCNA